MSYYIRGDKNRGKEVIALLQSRGGVNGILSGNNEECYYYINPVSGKIDCTASADSIANLKKFCTELVLPKVWIPKFKKGNNIITKATKRIGKIKDVTDTCYVIEFGIGAIGSSIETLTEESIELYKWSPQRGDRVLVRFNNRHPWEEAIFSYASDSNHYHTVGGMVWSHCIQFDIDKLGKITND